MSQYRILTQENGEEGQNYPLAPRSAKVVKALRKLQVASTFYTMQERYGFVKEMLWDEEWIEYEGQKEDENGDPVERFEFKLKPATMNPYDFLEEVSILLFPDAPIKDNLDHLDHEVAREALEDFTTRTDRKRAKLSALFS